MSDEIEVGTTKMTSQGQVVIPDSIRKNLNLSPGVQFVVFGSGDGVFFKPVKRPTVEEFKAMLAKTHEKARKAGITQEDIDEAIREYREKREPLSRSINDKIKRKDS